MKPRLGSLTFHGKKLPGRIFIQSPFSGDFLEILASEATGNHSPKWDEVLEIKVAAADPKGLLPPLEWVSHSLSPLSNSSSPSAGIFPSLLTQVCFLMTNKIGAPGEMLPTKSAPVGLLPSVGPLVCSEVGDITEGPPAFSTLIWPLTCVGAVVHSKAGAVAEALPTLTADVGCWL